MDKKNIETILPLTPLQQGFLWHSLASADRESAGLIQTQCRITGLIDRTLFSLAWQQTVAQHQMLRATVHWQKVKKPVIVVMRRMAADINYLEVGGPDSDAWSLENFLAADLEAGLPLEQGPAIRLTLIRVSDQVHELVWTSHHLLLDGWSGSLVLNELFARYDALVAAQPFAAERSADYAGFLQWLRRQDVEAARQYWVDLLAGYPAGPQPRRAGKPVEARISLDAAAADTLEKFVRGAQVTLNAVAQAAWAILLARIYDRPDVVFGVTVSGRQSDYAEAGRLVGMLVNVLPVRARPDPALTVTELVQAMHAQTFDSLPHAFVDVGQIQAWRSAPGLLFGTLLTVENHPAAGSPTSLTVSDQRSGIVSAFGVTLVVSAAGVPSIAIHSSEGVLNAAQANQLLAGLRSVITQMMTVPEEALQAIAVPGIESIRFGLLEPSDQSLMASSSEQGVPTAYLEQRLTTLWREVLGIDSVDPSASFFDLGGTSILATVLFNRLEADMGLRLPPTILFEHNSIASLTAVLGQDEMASQWEDLVVIQPGGDKPPLFIPDTATGLLIYRHLAAELGPTQPIYGFRARPLGHLTMDRIASRLNRQLLAIQPEGPYQLAGLSGAGALALQMAQQLRQQGQEVALVILFDCIGPDYPRLQSWAGRIASSLKRAGLVLYRRIVSPEQDRLHDTDLHWGLPATPAGSAEKPAPRMARLKSLMHAVTRNRPVPDQLANLLVLALLRIPAQSNRQAWDCFRQGLWLEYRAGAGENQVSPDEPIRHAAQVHEHLYSGLQVYDGRVLCFRAAERAPGVRDDPTLGWQRLMAGSFELHDVPGGHLSLIKPPHVRTLAAVLRKALLSGEQSERLQD